MNTPTGVPCQSLLSTVLTMRLSLSVRVAESFSNKRVRTLELSELARIAKDAGYGALCMRASVVGIHNADDEAKGVRSLLDRFGLAVSMITGDFAVPENGCDGPDCLRDITPHLDLATALGCSLIRVCMKEPEDIPFAQRAADEAMERGTQLAHQSHTLSLFETRSGTLDILAKIGRSNFGLIYEPANLALCGEDYGVETLRALKPYLFNVYLQNHAPDPRGDTPMETWSMGTVMSTIRPLEAPDGIDFSGLREVDYDGTITLHQAFGGVLPPDEAAERSAAFLRSLITAD